ncbi:uncharacterized protein THITE_2085263 [Thermothielavioides terrestris NRRL 8126]|uniref:F-box domain-containing protein n=1 Tax=Thermothielavioides terrestris (strain ATCC 38088 / NRRL 8126) TaxID=578455 RepID=G2QUV5_THETT|nr:uncharacterized protein THITE_2085263 [Thermothielavioides terrestris NRRL 8126]AEO63750.1 hypothetical protein THITE_2085263 [Thermothielavioides terrestris NRRL 8126]
MARFFAIDVPLEVLELIVRLLDPISVIALSQASSAWRALIRPMRHDFERRLLALELTPEHGGIVPLFHERDSSLTPPWDSDEWRTNKYACCGCMKLRTHLMFDNHAILRRPYRKPPPGSVEAERVAVTDWEPLEPAARWRRIQQQVTEDREARRIWAQARARQRELAGPPAHPFAPLPPEPETTYDDVERRLAGVSRQNRRCIECKRRRGHFSGKPNGVVRGPGISEVPVVISRQLRFEALWERHFPGLFPLLPPEMRPRNWPVLRRMEHGFLSSLYLIRCPSCTTWLEHSAFREWDMYRYGIWFPQRPVNPLLCNHCHLKTHRDPSLLAGQLAAAALDMLRSDRRWALFRLGFGWKFIYRDFNDNNALLGRWKVVEPEILAGLRWRNPREHDPEIEEADFDHLRRRLHRYRELIYNEVDPDTREAALQNWFRLWVEDYDLYEGMYHWLSQQIARIESDPHLVLNYVLERNPYRI